MISTEQQSGLTPLTAVILLRQTSGGESAHGQASGKLWADGLEHCQCLQDRLRALCDTAPGVDPRYHQNFLLSTSVLSDKVKNDSIRYLLILTPPLPPRRREVSDAESGKTSRQSDSIWHDREGLHRDRLESVHLGTLCDQWSLRSRLTSYLNPVPFLLGVLHALTAALTSCTGAMLFRFVTDSYSDSWTNS